MPKLVYRFEGDAFADGAGGDKFLIDLSEQMSTHYGRLIRQGQIFTVSSIDARVVNPDTTLQDEVIAVSGRYVYMEPTGNRIQAWKNGFQTVQSNRRLVGNHSKTGEYDFRVGLAPGYGTATGIFGTDGVRYNAWIKSDASPLMLAGEPEQGLCDVWNEQLGTVATPKNPGDGFGTWMAKNAGATGDELDFVLNEQEYFVKGSASTQFEYSPFACSFSNVIGSSSGVNGDIADTARDSLEGPIRVMCGLIGVYVDTTTVDDTSAQSQDWALEITVSVERWKPIISKRKKK